MVDCLLYLELKLSESFEIESIVIRFFLLELPYSFEQLKDLLFNYFVAVELYSKGGEFKRGLIEFYCRWWWQWRSL